jgi:hypothetical protein
LGARDPGARRNPERAAAARCPRARPYPAHAPAAKARGSRPGRLRRGRVIMEFANKGKRPAGIAPPTLCCNCRLAGPVPLLCIPVVLDRLVAPGAGRRHCTQVWIVRTEVAFQYAIGMQPLSLGLGCVGDRTLRPAMNRVRRRHRRAVNPLGKHLVCAAG